MKRGPRPGRIAFFILMGILAVVVFGGVVMALWNNVLAAVTNVHTITFWQALGLLLLSKILFGGFRGGGWGSGRYYWKRKMQQKWSNMTPDEREKFKQEWQRRCGGWGHQSWSEKTSSEEANTQASTIVNENS